MPQSDHPRLAVAGLAGDSGKTLVSLGLVRALRARGLAVAPFKKGPDFIDAAWLGAAAGRAGRNLDTFLMPEDVLLASLIRAGRGADISVVEGNRGLFDGLDAEGSHSTAQLARLTRTPVVLVVDTTKVTRTVAAQVLGCRMMEPDLNLVGVILNRVGTSRQEEVVRQAVAKSAGIPVLGAIPRLRCQHLPSRHLGLVTAMEHPETEAALDEIGAVVEKHIDIDSIIELAATAGRLDAEDAQDAQNDGETPNARVRIGVLRDRAFSFYYPENIEALAAAGAEVCFVSPLDDEVPPDVDALYVGGGFPEVHAARLSVNRSFREALAARVGAGLPVWAECGGLMYLSEAVVMGGAAYPMVGVLPISVELTSKPQGHGYTRFRVDTPNPFLEKGMALRGHEFHYSRLRPQRGTNPLPTVLEMLRGTGVGDGRDGIRVGSVVATYTHLHALGAPEWAAGVVRAAEGAA